VPHLSGDPQAASLLSPSPAEVEAISMPLRLASCEVQPSGEVFLVYTTLET